MPTLFCTTGQWTSDCFWQDIPSSLSCTKAFAWSPHTLIWSCAQGAPPVWTSRTIITKKLSKRNETRQTRKNATWTHRRWPATPSLTRRCANIPHLNSQKLIDARLKTWFEVTWDKCDHCNQNNSNLQSNFLHSIPKQDHLPQKTKWAKDQKTNIRFNTPLVSILRIQQIN